MNKIHTKYLHINYPDLYKIHYNNKIGFIAFECDDGWFNLLLELSKKLYFLMKKSKIKISVSQVKEKFAGLRYYYNERCPSKMDRRVINLWSAIISDVVSELEREAESICEICGNYGSIKRRGTWYKTLCDKCTKKEKYNAPRV